MLRCIKTQSTELCGGVLGGGEGEVGMPQMTTLICGMNFCVRLVTSSHVHVRNSRVGQRLCSNVMDDQLLVVG